MTKIILCIMLIPLGFIVGSYFGKRYRNRVAELLQCEHMLLKIAIYIESQNIHTTELIERLSISESLNRLTFLPICAKKLEENKSFPQMWRQSLEQSRSTLSLQNDDYELLARISELIGSLDSNGIKSGVELIKSELSHNIKHATEQSRIKGALCTRLGLLAGILLAIILM